MKKLTDPQKIAEINTAIREFWKNIQAELATADPAAIAANNFWKEYCGIDFNVDFDTLNPPCRYVEPRYRGSSMYFMVGNKSFRFDTWCLAMIRKRNPYVILNKHLALKHKALSYFNTQMLGFTYEIEILNLMHKHAAR